MISYQILHLSTHMLRFINGYDLCCRYAVVFWISMLADLAASLVVVILCFPAIVTQIPAEW